MYQFFFYLFTHTSLTLKTQRFIVLSYGFHTLFTHKHHMTKCVAGTDLWPNTWSEEEESEE